MSRLSKNIIYNFSGQGLLIVLGFISVKYIFKQLGEDALGIIYFTIIVNSMLCGMLEMGICTTSVREVSAYSNTDPDYIRDLVRTGSFFYWSAFGLLGLIFFSLSPVVIEKWINLKSMDPPTAISILRILGIASLVALPKSFYVSLLRGLQRMEFNNFIDVIATGLQQFGTILVLAFGGGLFYVVYWFALCYLLKILTYLIVIARFFSLKSLIPAYSVGVIKKNLRFTSRMIFISITGAIYTQIDKVIISKIMPIGVVGYYGLAYSNVSKGQLLTGAVSQAAYPSFSKLFNSGDRPGLMSRYKKLQDLICFGTLPIFALIPFALLPLFSYVLNEEAARLILLPATLLCIGFYMNATLHIPYIFSLAVGNPGIAARQHFYDLFVTLPATVLLVYFWGLVGAGLSLIFLYLFHYFYAMPRICVECLKISTWSWYFHILKVAVLGRYYLWYGMEHSGNSKQSFDFFFSLGLYLRVICFLDRKLFFYS